MASSASSSLRGIASGTLPQIWKHRLSVTRSVRLPIDIGQDDVPLVPQNVKYVASYNRTNDPQPTILVPGSPRQWLDLPLPLVVPCDVPDTPRIFAEAMLPMLRAADTIALSHPECAVDWSTIDVVADLGVLRTLLHWIHRFSNPHMPWKDVRGLESFGSRFDVQPTTGRTVLLHRIPPTPRRLAWGRKQRPHTSFGSDFERLATAPGAGCERGLEHYRAIQYDFGGLRLVVSGEVDACIPQDADPSSTSPPPAQAPIGSPPDPPERPALPPRSADIAVVPAGAFVPQSALLEIKTEGLRHDGGRRVHAWMHTWSRTYPQMLLSQTPTLLAAGRVRETFVRVRRTRVDADAFRAEAARWADVQRDLRLLVPMLRRFCGVARARGAPFTARAFKDRWAVQEVDRAREHWLLGPEDLERFAPRAGASWKVRNRTRTPREP
ncbi:uncharacterized protein BXZ73DRAFT_104965 [Epithele typhae]|uniref:uncharacterized protein n=1 Tax=Epithele typhae TaxID=378194 RepID=UPI00200856E8|nr:uncharacterized protein BXZ73DRAFT_104965 [Epithele typhae]KAH9919492.1 hypothetical protein BXZ73DRAFT_104965 [Epithele typhae]